MWCNFQIVLIRENYQIRKELASKGNIILLVIFVANDIMYYVIIFAHC